MSESSVIKTDRDDQVLAELIERLTERLASGEKLNIDSIVVEHPEQASRLRAIWPALQTLVEIGNAQPANASALGTLGDFRLIRELGRGGMGIVYEAEQLSLRRRVALKTLPFAGTLDERALARFRNEALAAAALHHPHVVPIYGVGCERSTHFLAMQLIDGISLDRAIASLAASSSVKDELASSDLANAESTDYDTVPAALRSTERVDGEIERFSAVARLVADAADALHYAHERGVIHRDIKPANLLLDRHGDVWITDFGLARVEGAENLTRTGDLLGTWRYLSPEQAAGNRLGVDHRTDIYSLGATLYELLTLHPVIDGAGRERLLQQVLTAEPRALRTLDARIPSELETITLKALAKEPADRYATAAEFAADLRCFVERRPIRARPVSFVQRARAWARRHAGWLLSAAIGLSVVALVVSLAATIAWQAESRTRQALIQSHENLDLAAARERELRIKLYAGDLPAAQRAWEAGDSQTARELLARHLPTATDKDDRRGFEWHYLWQLCRRQPVTVQGHSDAVTAADFSHDGQLLATGDRQGVLKFWRLPELQKVGEVAAHIGEVRDIYFPAERGEAITVGSDGVIHGWNPETGSNVWSIRRDGETFTAAALSPDESVLAVASDDRVVRCWNIATRELIHTLPKVASPVVCLEFCSRPELTLYAGEIHGPIHGWRVATGERVHEPLGSFVRLSALQITHDGAILLTGSHDATARLYDLPAGIDRGYTFVQDGRVLCAAIMPGRKAMVSAGDEGSVRFWEFATSMRHLRYRRTLLQTEHDISCLEFSRDARYLLLADTMGLLRLLEADDLLSGFQYRPLQPAASFRPNEWDLSRDGRLLAMYSDRGQLDLFEVATGKRLSSVATDGKQVSGLCFAPDAQTIAVSCIQNGASQWDVSNPAAPALSVDFVSPPQVERCNTYSPSGRWLGLCTKTRVLLWDVKTRQVAHQFPMDQVMHLQFSDDEKLLVASSHRGELSVWDLEDCRLLSQSKTTTRSAGRIAISPDGKHLARGTASGLEIFPLPDLKSQDPVFIHGRIAHLVCFSPDSKTLVTSSAGDVRMIHVATWSQLVHCQLLEHGVGALAFSPDGQSLIAAGSKVAELSIRPPNSSQHGE